MQRCLFLLALLAAAPTLAAVGDSTHHLQCRGMRVGVITGIGLVGCKDMDTGKSYAVGFGSIGATLSLAYLHDWAMTCKIRSGRSLYGYYTGGEMRFGAVGAMEFSKFKNKNGICLPDFGQFEFGLSIDFSKAVLIVIGD